MAIKEKDLQTVNSIEGGKLRCVTANGESRNVPADAIGGGDVFIANVTSVSVDGEDMSREYVTLDKTYSEIYEAVQSGKVVILIDNKSKLHSDDDKTRYAHVSTYRPDEINAYSFFDKGRSANCIFYSIEPDLCEAYVREVTCEADYFYDE